MTTGAVRAPLPDGALVADTIAPITTGLLDALRFAGYRGLVSYLPLPGKASSWDWDPAELRLALRAGFGCGFVQRARYVGWRPTESMGLQTGRAAAAGARRLGTPDGTLLWCDLEGVQPRVPAGDVMAYCEAWAAPVLAGGYAAGLYVGAGCGLSGAQLGALPSFHRYWDSLSHNPRPEPRGYCLMQEAQREIQIGRQKIAIDRNRTCMDARGARAEFCWLAEVAP